MIKHLFFLLLFSVIFFSCKNEEGEGGSSVVQGYIYKIIHSDNNFTFRTDTVPASKEDVFIIYGNENFYGNDLKADASGFYKFSYLTEGSYTLFSYNSQPDGTREKVAVSVNVDKYKTIQADTLFIHTGDSYGTSIVKGTINVIYYKKGVYEATGKGIGQRVFICNSGEEVPFNDVKSGINGVFGFEKLKPGAYDIFVITKDPNTEVESTIKQTISVVEADTIYTLPAPFTIVVAV